MSGAMGLLLNEGDHVAYLPDRHALAMYAVVCGPSAIMPNGQRLVPIRTTAHHQLAPRGAEFHAPAGSVRRRPKGRHAAQGRPWWRRAKLASGLSQ